MRLKHLCMCLLQGYSLPILPMVLPPAIQALMHSPPAGTPEQQVHQAAAAAAAAAAVMSSPYSTYSTMMLPPSIIPLGALSCHPQRVYLFNSLTLCRASVRDCAGPYSC